MTVKLFCTFNFHLVSVIKEGKIEHEKKTCKPKLFFRLELTRNRREGKNYMWDPQKFVSGGKKSC